jgi:hypothetical protein
MGSGKYIKNAIAKHGIDNFNKEILNIFDNEIDMNNKEKELVVLSEKSYNLCAGGHGGFGYINANFTGEQKKVHKAKQIYLEKLRTDDAFKQRCQQNLLAARSKPECKQNQRKYFDTHSGSFTGKKHSPETIIKMKQADRSGIKNSQFGTIWVTNGIDNKKIKKHLIDEFKARGYYSGRFFK